MHTPLSSHPNDLSTEKRSKLRDEKREHEDKNASTRAGRDVSTREQALQTYRLKRTHSRR